MEDVEGKGLLSSKSSKSWESSQRDARNGSDGRDLLDFFQIALAPDDNAHIAFADGRAGGSASNTVTTQAT